MSDKDKKVRLVNLLVDIDQAAEWGVGHGECQARSY